MYSIYRAKISSDDFDGPQWVYGDIVRDSGGTPFRMVRWNGNVVNVIEIDEMTVCQHTGAVDINGERIFEGDIIEMAFLDESEGKWIHVEGHRYRVCWDEETCAFIYRDEEWPSNAYGLSFDRSNHRYKVVGNVFDNPEMTKYDPFE